MLNSMVHGLSWNWTGHPNHSKVSNLLAILDARLWRAGTATVKCGMDTATGFGKYVL
ncbi:hypothetical protein TIFTF001_035094 [Ficus carica]|uniref:Uncharacterized protein n=1 Tax=Ficus carica TaxID=3494 RepID=A0AA88E456_FICCA|nr:hypothetical protein TIFTF001_035094 [Ficus carica]